MLVFLSIAFGLFAILATVATLRALSRAQLGYEDETGFHLGVPPEPAALRLAGASEVEALGQLMQMSSVESENERGGVQTAAKPDTPDPRRLRYGRPSQAGKTGRNRRAESPFPASANGVHSHP